MIHSRNDRKARSRFLLHVALAALLLALTALAGTGCGVRHLGPYTGQAFHRVFGMQLKPHLAPNEQALQLTAEDAELVMANMREQTKRSESRQARSSTQMLLPISK